MNKHTTKIILILAMLMLAILACEASASTANIKDAMMARDAEGTQLTTVFTPEETFYCLVDLANAPDDTTLKAIWTAVQTDGSEPDTFIYESEITRGSGSIYFELSSSIPWPKGTYKVDIYLNGELDRTIEFEVQ